MLEWLLDVVTRMRPRPCSSIFPEGGELPGGGGGTWPIVDGRGRRWERPWQSFDLSNELCTAEGTLFGLERREFSTIRAPCIHDSRFKSYGQVTIEWEKVFLRFEEGVYIYMGSGFERIFFERRGRRALRILLRILLGIVGIL